MPISSEQLISNGATAMMLAIHPVTLNRWRREGRGPRFIYIGSIVKYRRSDVSEYITKGEVLPEENKSPRHGRLTRTKRAVSA